MGEFAVEYLLNVRRGVRMILFPATLGACALNKPRIIMMAKETGL